MTISIVINSRADAGPMESVVAALPEAVITRFNATGMSPAIAMSQALTFFTAAFTHQKAQRVIVLGDRYETLAAALAAMFLRIPVAHIHGGERTTGAFDDPMRHAITHIADLHFCAIDDAADKVDMLLGAEYLGPYHVPGVHVVGAPGLDGIERNSARRDRTLILVTYHPETRALDYGLAGCRAMLEAISTSLLGYEIVFCGVNNDPGSLEIRALIKEHCNTRGGRVEDSLAHYEYISLMQSAALVIGNSSAAIIEAPWIGVPTVNIGKRQHGRAISNSVYCAAPDADDIKLSIDRALKFSGNPCPQYRGGAAPQIAAIIRESLHCPQSIAI